MRILTSFLSMLLLGGLFAAFCVLTGKYEFLVVIFAVLGASSLRRLLAPRWHGKLEEIPVLGEAARLYKDLEAHYVKAPTPSLLSTVAFPITGALRLLSREGRQQLKAHFNLMQWVFALVGVSLLASYQRFYKHLGLDFAWDWMPLELGCLYFLLSCFLISTLTTSIRLSQAGASRAFFGSSLAALLAIAALSGWMMRSPQYANAIPISLTMQQRAQELKKRRLFKQAGAQQQAIFFDKLQDSTRMFLAHYAPRIQRFHRRNLHLPPGSPKLKAFYELLDEEFQQHIAGITRPGEQRRYHLTTRVDVRQLTGVVLAKGYDALIYAFHYDRGFLDIYANKSKLPRRVKRRLQSEGLVLSHLPLNATRLMSAGLLLDHEGNLQDFPGSSSFWALLGWLLALLSALHAAAICLARWTGGQAGEEAEASEEEQPEVSPAGKSDAGGRTAAKQEATAAKRDAKATEPTAVGMLLGREGREQAPAAQDPHPPQREILTEPMEALKPCAYHELKPSVEHCSQCGSAICEECQVDEESRCFKCVYEERMEDGPLAELPRPPYFSVMFGALLGLGSLAMLRAWIGLFALVFDPSFAAFFGWEYYSATYQILLSSGAGMLSIFALASVAAIRKQRSWGFPVMFSTLVVSCGLVVSFGLPLPQALLLWQEPLSWFALALLVGAVLKLLQLRDYFAVEIDDSDGTLEPG